VVKAAFDALGRLKNIEAVARLRGRPVSDLVGGAA
jgi:ribosomal protein S5